MFLVNFQRVACPQRAGAWRSAFLTNAFLFRAFTRSGGNKNERNASSASGDDGPGNRRDSGDDDDDDDDERTGEDHEASVEADGAYSKSGARRTGQPRPGAPGSRPRIGSAADLLPFFTTYALRLTSFFSSPRRAIIR
ncbi:hypothetical protein CFB43_30140 [Burkholderia sp. AU15512]|nr:hypothetical protein CFB43_30140 [Burkholderia sp. AU15512]